MRASSGPRQPGRRPCPESRQPGRRPSRLDDSAKVPEGQHSPTPPALARFPRGTGHHPLRVAPARGVYRRARPPLPPTSGGVAGRPHRTTLPSYCRAWLVRACSSGGLPVTSASPNQQQYYPPKLHGGHCAGMADTVGFEPRSQGFSGRGSPGTAADIHPPATAAITALPQCLSRSVRGERHDT